MKKIRTIISAVWQYLKNSDTLLLIMCLIASVYGMLLIYSVTHGDFGMGIVFVQAVALVIGIALYVVLSLIDISLIADKSVILYIVSVLFISTLFVWGVAGDSGNRAWLRFGGFGIQPAEVVKIPFTIILARMITVAKNKHSLNSFKSVFSEALMFISLFGLIIVSSSDLGSALVYAFIFLVMLFSAGLSLWWFLGGFSAIVIAFPFIWQNFLNGNQKDRILAPYVSSIDPTGLGIMWQSNQSKAAISAGGFAGSGYLNGKMTQSGLVPQQYTDFIFSAAGEEFGFIGCLLIVAILLLIIIRCVYVGIRSNNTLGLLVCIGIAGMMLFQTIENIGMCLGLTPVIGLTLPFFSYGGSSVLTNFAAMGIISGIKMRPQPERYRRY